MFRGISQHDQILSVPANPCEDRIPVRVAGKNRICKLLQDLLILTGLIIESNGFRANDRLELRLTQVQTIVVNVLLHHRIDQIGDVAVVIDVLADSCRADVL